MTCSSHTTTSQFFRKRIGYNRTHLAWIQAIDGLTPVLLHAKRYTRFLSYLQDNAQIEF